METLVATLIIPLGFFKRVPVMTYIKSTKKGYFITVNMNISMIMCLIEALLKTSFIKPYYFKHYLAWDGPIYAEDLLDCVVGISLVVWHHAHNHLRESRNGH